MAATNPKQHNYVLVLKDGSRRDFEAQDAAHALKEAQAILAEGHSASLCQDGELLAEISYSAQGYWAVSTPSSASGRC